MNKYINKIFLTSVITLAGMLGATSCTDYLDKSPYSDIEENDPYKNFKNFQGFTEELYNCIPVVSNSEYHTSFNFGEEDYWEPQELRLFARNIDYGDFWDGLPVIILILLLYVVERLIHRNAVIRVICGNFAGMVSVRLTLV